MHELDLRHQRVNTIVNSLISLHSFIYDLITRIAIFNQYEKKKQKKKKGRTKNSRRNDSVDFLTDKVEWGILYIIGRHIDMKSITIIMAAW